MIEINVNNGRIMEFEQAAIDKTIRVLTVDKHRTIDNETHIPAGDMVMLINLYNYIKSNDIQNDFINPNGKNKE